VQQELGSDSGDEEKITIVGLQGKVSSHASSSSTVPSLANDKRRSELFHIRVVTKHTKVETLFVPGSQVNLISEEIVKKLGLTTRPHQKPYPLGWVSDNAKLQVTRKCRLRFAIAFKLIDEVDLNVVPLDIYGIVLGSPSLYDKKTIFFRKENKYHLTKDGVEYIIRAHSTKANPSLISAGQMKRAINTCKNLVLTVVKAKDPNKSNAFDTFDPFHKNEILEIRQVFQWEGRQQRAFDTLREKINTTPVLAIPDPQQPFKIGTNTSANAMRAVMLFRPPSFASIVLKNASLAHVSYVEQYAIDEVFKDVCECLILGLQVKRFCL